MSNPEDSYPIEKGKPLQGGRGIKKYPWDKMAIGDSFFIPGKRSSQVSPAARQCRPAQVWNWRYSCRTEKDDNGNVLGTRVFRIEEDPRWPSPPHAPQLK